jgi:hypothetical protein
MAEVDLDAIGLSKLIEVNRSFAWFSLFVMSDRGIHIIGKGL